MNDFTDVQLMFDFSSILSGHMFGIDSEVQKYFERDSPSDFNVPFFRSVITYYLPMK